MSITSISLLDRIRRDSDAQSWDRLVSLYLPWIDNILKQAEIAGDDRDDLRQDVLAVVCREIGSFQHNGRTGAFRRWLRDIVMNRLRNYWRQKQSRGQRFVAVELETLPDRIRELETIWDCEHDRFLMQELLKQAEPAFTQATWKAFCLQTLDQWDATRCASELGISVNAALLAKSRVLQHLRTEAAEILDEL
ncbi:MAG: sigma-70 family RNA polymerase sigma factor [Planctomycetes bacterium]|nr:sigma-70 family RNA polymerase sigma factor [Planctomycetota bacterium]